MRIGEFELNKIYCVDCLEKLNKIPKESINMIITDPPYFLGFVSSKEGGRRDWGNHSVLMPLFDKLFKEFKRILKPTGRVFMFTDWRTYPTLYLSCSKYIDVSNMIVWDYGWIKAGTQFRFTHELILHVTMPRAESPKDRSMSDVWRIKPVDFTKFRNHPAEKPVKIIIRMLEETSKKGDVILDPFLGSGTTAVACKQLDRNFIGFEINPQYVEIANNRLEQTNIKRWFKDKNASIPPSALAEGIFEGRL